MAEIVSIAQGTHKGQDGFIITFEMSGFNKGAAQFRAIGMTALRFPTTITEIEAVSANSFNEGELRVQTFVPTEGFLSAGIESPIGWLNDQFDRDVLGFFGN